MRSWSMTYVAKNLRRSEILDFMQRDYGQYVWSMRTLARWMSHFAITYINYDNSRNSF